MNEGEIYNMRDYDYSDLVDVATDAEHKADMLDLLVEFDKFCEEHGLRYYLSGGTLLGAVRHKGFIPWDDDVDVNMPRPDCEKLMELSGGKIGRYELLPPNSTDKYHAYHWKLYDDGILVAKKKPGGIGEKVYPIFLDIFPIEGLPATDAENIEHYNKIVEKKRRASYVWSSKRYRGRNPYRILRNRLAIWWYKNIGIEKLFNEVIEIATSISFDEADYVGVMMTNVHTTEERVVKSEYTPIIKMEFEGKMLSCPAGYDAYLRQLFGDNYMEWLPPHQRVPKHGLVPFISKTNTTRERDLSEANKAVEAGHSSQIDDGTKDAEQ